MRALVTGASGYLGLHLCRILGAAGWEIHAVVRPQSDPSRVEALEATAVHELDDDPGCLARIFAEAAPESVLHLAAAPPEPDADAADVAYLDRLVAGNVGLCARIAAAMAAAPGAVLVHAASWWEWDSEARLRPANIYAATKANGRILLETAARGAPFAMASLVLHDTYGPADWRHKVLTAMLRAAAEQHVLELSPGEQRVDPVHVEDVAEAFRMTAEALTAGPSDAEPALWAVATGEPLTLRALAAAVEAAVGRPVDARWAAKPYRPGTVMSPGRMALPPPGWEPRVPLLHGLKDAYERVEK